ncbi:MAG: hypothetical protein ABJA18_05885 [bacterium]
MSFPINEIAFKRNAVEPVACLKAGLELVKTNYWLFVAMVFLVTISGVVPFGLLLAPMMCGLYLTLFRARRGQRIEFANLFEGFNYFGDAVVATLLHIIPILVIIVPAYIIFYVGFFAAIGLSQISGTEPNPAVLIGFLGMILVIWLVVMVVVIVISVVFIFAYPLIVDRRLSGLNAVKLSIRAGWANFWRLLGMMLLGGLLVFVGALFCYVGALFVAPIMYGAIASAYEQVFGLGQPSPNIPPAPPSFV